MKAMRGESQFLAVILAFVLGVSNAQPCGIDLNIPQNHFDGVNEWGYVSHWEEIAKVNFGDGLEFPLSLNWRSDREYVSPYIGAGFTIPLLESRWVQVDERKYLVTNINGIQTYYVRAKAEDKVLRGSGGWLAEINGDHITSWSPCGWKLTYSRGKISSITTPKSRKIEYVHSGNKVSELRENGVARLRVEMNPETGYTKALVFNGIRLEIAMGDRPRVQVIAGQKVVGGIAPSLHRVTGAGMPDRGYDFAVNAQLFPTLSTSGSSSHFYTWDPGTKRIIADNKWSYKIKPSTETELYAEIHRTHEGGQTEFWHNDLARGRELVKNAKDDFTLAISRFAGTGPLVGQLRKIERIKGGKVEPIHTTAYDERGLLQRETIENGIVKRHSYTKEGALEGIVEEKGGVPTLRLSFDSKRRVKSREEADGRRFTYVYDEQGREREIYINQSLHLKREWSAGGRSVEEKVFAADGKTLARTFYEEFDESGRSLLKRVSEYSFKTDPVTTRYLYDALGRLKELNSTRDGISQYSYAPDGKQIVSRLEKIVRQ